MRARDVEKVPVQSLHAAEKERPVWIPSGPELPRKYIAGPRMQTTAPKFGRGLLFHDGLPPRDLLATQTRKPRVRKTVMVVRINTKSSV